MTERTKKTLKSIGISLLFWLLFWGGKGLFYDSASYFYVLAATESIPHGTGRAAVNGRLFGFQATEVADIKKEHCGYCGGPGDVPNAKVYRYVFKTSRQELRCYLWFDQQDRLFLIGPDYE
ncbi:MAG: hypothetical protein K1Y36_02435 [Blastocatellia bacterium]|nr:hypothetical protein [Blastocatellia bacterium]